MVLLPPNPESISVFVVVVVGRAWGVMVFEVIKVKWKVEEPGTFVDTGIALVTEAMAVGIVGIVGVGIDLVLWIMKIGMVLEPEMVFWEHGMFWASDDRRDGFGRLLLVEVLKSTSKFFFL